tara:strand:+ start:1055 stop:1387 length:333 start_codon:yes stop_codon:yes gene_type:complete
MSEGVGFNDTKAGTDCTWITATDRWSEAFYTWLNACFTQGGGTTATLTRIRKGKKEHQRRFCKLIAEIKGEEYEETKYFRPDIQVTASDIKLVDKELKKINLNVFINKKK